MSFAHPPQHRRPLWLAAIVVSFAVPLGYWLLSVVWSSLLMGEFSLDGDVLQLILYNGVPISTAATFILGLPVALVLRRSGLLTAALLCLAAALIGALAACIFLTYRAAWMGTGFGLAGGVIFCLVAGISWRPRHPQRIDS